MTGWNVPPSAAVPPGVGLTPPPGVAMPYEPEEEEAARPDAREERAQDMEADRYESTHDLLADASYTRDRIGRDVAELRHRFGMDDEAKARRRNATGPLAPARRHPMTTAAAAAGALAVTAVGIKFIRDHRGSLRLRKAQKAALKQRRLARKRAGEAWELAGAAAQRLRPRRKSALRRWLHR